MVEALFTGIAEGLTEGAVVVFDADFFFGFTVTLQLRVFFFVVPDKRNVTFTFILVLPTFFAVTFPVLDTVAIFLLLVVNFLL